MDLAKLLHVSSTTKLITTAAGDPVYVPQKAYKNLDWLTSSGAKPVRILSEYLETEQRLLSANVKSTILFFGSARSKSREQYQLEFSRLQLLPEPKRGAELQKLQRKEWMCEYFDKSEELATKLTEWSMARVGPDGTMPYMIATGRLTSTSVTRSKFATSSRMDPALGWVGS